MPARDLTPYELATRLIMGLPVTDQGKLEIAQELNSVRVLISETARGAKPGSIAPEVCVREIAKRIDPDDES